MHPSAQRAHTAVAESQTEFEFVSVLGRGAHGQVLTVGVALAQAAPGPNLLFVPVLGHAIAGLPGAVVALAGMLLPSTTLALFASRWGRKRRDTLGVRAFVAGMAPVTIGLLAAAGTVLASMKTGETVRDRVTGQQVKASD